MLTPLELPGFGGVSLAGLLFLCLAAVLAGGVDAVVGGGGLIQLPALMLLNPGGAAIYALATNKMSSIVGTTAAARTYVRHTPIEWPAALTMAGAAFTGSLGGAVLAGALPSTALNLVVLVALVGVGLHTWRRRDLGVAEEPRFGRGAQVIVMSVGGAILGFYDGLAGPGTGSFLVFFLVGLMGYAFLHASATSKLVNIATNLGALVFFIPTGKVLWGLAAVMACCNVAGAMLGASVALRRGSVFVRRVFLTMVVTLIFSLTWKLAL